MNEKIPFIDLHSEWAPIIPETLQRIKHVFEHGQFIMGPEVYELEAHLKAFIGVNYAVTCNSGTTALLIALMALDLKPGDEVILPAYTFAAPLEVVLLLGAIPVLADINPLTYTICPASANQLITPRTRAIIAASLYGQPADFIELNKLGEKWNIPVIEDAAQSFGSTLNGLYSGALSTIGCTSFFPTKPLGGSGEGGALFTNDFNLYKRFCEIRDHGQDGKYNHIRLGINGRMNSIECAALLTRLKYLPEILERRQEVARNYYQLLHQSAEKSHLQLPMIRENVTSVFSQYPVLLSNRDITATRMEAANIQVALHYPTTLYQQPAFRTKVKAGPLTHAENIAKHLLCLPIYPNLTLNQQMKITSRLLEIIYSLVLDPHES